MFRPVRKHQAIRIKREPTRTPVWSTEEYGRGEYPREYAKDLLEIAQERTLDALHVTAFDAYLFRRKETGRKCSCLENPEAHEPDMNCPVCWGTGIVGGWDKEGCVLEVFDVTYPYYSRNKVIIHPHYRPHFFEGSVLGNGVVEFTYQAPPAKEVDALEVFGEEVECFIADDSPTPSWLPLTEESVNALLRGNTLNWKIKVEFSRESKLKGIYLRLKVDEVTYKVELSQLNKALSAGDFMLPDLFDGVQAALDPRLPDLNTGDFLEIVSANKRLRIKPTDITIYEAMDVSLGYEATIRPITELEVMTKIP